MHGQPAEPMRWLLLANSRHLTELHRFAYILRRIAQIYRQFSRFHIMKRRFHMAKRGICRVAMGICRLALWKPERMFCFTLRNAVSHGEIERMFEGICIVPIPHRLCGQSRWDMSPSRTRARTHARARDAHAQAQACVCACIKAKLQNRPKFYIKARRKIRPKNIYLQT